MATETLAVLLTGEDAGCDATCVEETRDNFESVTSGFGHHHLKCQAIRRVGEEGLSGAKVIIVPGGDVWPDSDDDEDSCQLGALGEKGTQVISQAVCEEGAIYIGICAGAFLALEIEGFGLADKVEIVHREIFGFAENGEVQGYIPLKEGSNPVPELLHAMKPLLEQAWYDNGPLMECAPCDDIRVLATYDGPLRRENYISEKMSTKVKADTERAWLEEAPKMYGKAAVVACRVGKGVVILMSPHPELSVDCHEVLPHLAAAAREWATANFGDEEDAAA
eukprot:TRINITY_DN6563_c0_g5_i1.p1 TRINITY_DN6563_c0_g5~~TRINITY_DN6563_c0_g5_i1.p1  ORF type:complete len:303 (+),score=65.38 TRINITY_DN6563_c0_g5_i1:75-911(+)